MILHAVHSICSWYPDHARTTVRWLLALIMMFGNTLPLLANSARCPRVGVLDARPANYFSKGLLSNQSPCRSSAGELVEASAQWELTQWDFSHCESSEESPETSEAPETIETSESSGSSSPELIDEEVVGHRESSAPLRRSKCGSSLKWTRSLSWNHDLLQTDVRNSSRTTLLNGCGAVLRI